MKIVIVGGGAAGLGAAATLLGNAAFTGTVILVEAQNDLGGRADTQMMGPAPFEHGPQFIQDPGPEVSDDPNQNPWPGIARMLNTFMADPNADAGVKQKVNTYFTTYTAGQFQRGPTDPLFTLIPDEINYNCNRIRVDGVEDDAPPQWITGADPQTTSEYLNQIERAYLAACKQSSDFPNLPAAPVVQPNEYLRTAQEYVLAIGSTSYGPIQEAAETWQYVAADRKRQEDQTKAQLAKYYNGAEDFGPNLFVEQGLGTLVRTYGAYLRALYADRLTVITSRAVSSIVTNAQSNLATVTLPDQQITDVDRCIITLPVWPLRAIQFAPPLPQSFWRACEFLPLGIYKKVAFRITGDFPDGFDVNKGFYQADGAYCWQYFRLPTAPSLVIGIAAGNFGESLIGQPDDAVVDRFLTALSGAWGGFDFGAVMAGGAVVTKWEDVSQIGGAYSYTRYNGGDPGNPVPLDARKTIARQRGVLHFAGEATWTAAYGTLHGAYLSGVRAAKAAIG